MHSIPDVCDVALVRGSRASAEPELLLEVPHGATRAADFDALRSALRGTYPADLREFFFVNTDVGAPEVAQCVAERVVAADARRSCAASSRVHSSTATVSSTPGRSRAPRPRAS